MLNIYEQCYEENLKIELYRCQRNFVSRNNRHTYSYSDVSSGKENKIFA